MMSYGMFGIVVGNSAQFWFFWLICDSDQIYFGQISATFICGPELDTGLMFCNENSVCHVTTGLTFPSLKCDSHRNPALAGAGATRVDITNMADSSDGSHEWKETDSVAPRCLSGRRMLTFACCQPVQPNSNALPQIDGSAEMSVSPWESCGEALADVVKGTPWHAEILDKVCFCEAAYVTIPPHLAPHPHATLFGGSSHCSTKGYC